jgi:transposase-like protein
VEYEHPGAAASLREGLEETLTVTRLGLTGALYRSLRTTNLIESLNSSIETYIRNVNRWRGWAMAQRWVSAALLDAEKRLRRVRGHRDLPRLVTALDAHSPGVTETARVAWNP